MATPAMGHAAKLGIGAANPVTEPFEFNSESIRKQPTHAETEGIRGTRSHISENVTESIYTVGGSLVLRPNPAGLALLFPRILGAAAAGTTFAMAETLPEFFLTVDRVTKVFTYAGCKVNRAVFRSSRGQRLTLELDIHGKTETIANAGTFPALTLSTEQPYEHHQSVITLAGTTREVDNIEITIDNALVLDRFNNSQSRTALPEGDRVVMFSCDTPFSADEYDLYNQAVAGAAGSVVYTNGGFSTTFTFGRLQAPVGTPTVGGKQEIPLRFEAVARMVGSTRELVVTHDSTA